MCACVMGTMPLLLPLSYIDPRLSVHHGQRFTVSQKAKTALAIPANQIDGVTFVADTYPWPAGSGSGRWRWTDFHAGGLTAPQSHTHSLMSRDLM
jgi:hypothetical protein